MISNTQQILPIRIGKTVNFSADKAPLSGALHRSADHTKAAIVLHGATAEPHLDYRHFAAWLAVLG